jgi:hypothetical protein
MSDDTANVERTFEGDGEEHVRLTIPEGYQVPRSGLDTDHPLRRTGVIVTKIEDAYDIRLSLPLHIRLAEEQVEGDLGKYSSEIAKNAGQLMTRDLWSALVPLIRTKIEEFDDAADR